MERQQYFKQAWGLLTRDKGWIKPLLVMTVADYVPIVGVLGTSGYALEWARLTAWGVDSSPKQKNVQVGKCIESGWRAFVVSFTMGLCVSLVFAILRSVFNAIPEEVGAIFLVLLGLFQIVFYLIYSVFYGICAIRTSIYERIGAGFRIDRVFEMMKRDMSGLARIVLFTLVAVVVVFVVVVLLSMLFAVALMPIAMLAAGGSSRETLLSVLPASMMAIVVCVVFLTFITFFIANCYRMILYTMIALWMRQFDIPSWGKSSDPLPEPAVQSKSQGPASVQPQRTNIQQNTSVSAPQAAKTSGVKPKQRVSSDADAVTPVFNPGRDAAPSLEPEPDAVTPVFNPGRDAAPSLEPEPDAVTPVFNPGRDAAPSNSDEQWSDDEDETLVYEEDAPAEPQQESEMPMAKMEPAPAPEPVRIEPVPAPASMPASAEPTPVEPEREAASDVVAREPKAQSTEDPVAKDPAIDDLYKRLDGIINSDDE